MARPTVIRDETIIDAAREVFLERGFGATTAEVAVRAGGSEGSIFKRFNSKVDLFQAAMRSHLDQPNFLQTLIDRVGKGEVWDNLVEIGLQVVAFYRTVTPLIMMTWSNPGTEGIPCMLNDPSSPALRTLKHMTGFFEAESRAGRLRRHDPEVVARTFLGAIHNFVFFELVFKDQDQLPMPAETFVRGLVNLLWIGIAPSESGPSLKPL